MARRCQWKVISLSKPTAHGRLLTSFAAGSALIQACEKAGVTIPRYDTAHIDLANPLLLLTLCIRYCYHEYVPILSNFGSVFANTAVKKTLDCGKLWVLSLFVMVHTDTMC